MSHVFGQPFFASAVRIVAVFVFTGAASVVCANDTPVDFQNDLIPVLTKHGCNAGACHGAAIGRGGLKLSLYGGDPAADFNAIAREDQGRRINAAHADRSLIALKATESVSHGGGQRFDIDSPAAELLHRWIEQGASATATRTLTRVDVSPKRHVAKATEEAITLSAKAHYSDGTTRDVTAWTIFAAEDSSAVKVNEEQTATVLRRGRHVVVARFLSEVIPIELIVPMSDEDVDTSEQPIRNFIDAEVVSTLKTLKLQPSGQADDSTFLRRLTIDLTGQLPTADAAKTVANKTKPMTQEERLALVDRLLQSDEFNDYWTFQLAKLLRLRPQRSDAQSMQAYHDWLKEQVSAKVSYRNLTTALITATGDCRSNGPPNFYRNAASAGEQAEFFSELLMGSRLRCANCHNHPLDRWTQDDYHGLAAIFATLDRGEVVEENPSGKVIHPRTRETARAKIPGEQFLKDRGPAGRQQLAEWLTSADNPYFAKAIVNRLWKHMMGRGLVEPVDDFRATNPATHAALLTKLADDFIKNGYQLRHTLKQIAASAAYQRSATMTDFNRDDDRFYSHAIPKPLEAEVLADAMSDVLQIPTAYADRPLGTRAIELVSPTTPSPALDVLGRCGRDESCETQPVAAGGLSQKLHLFNGDLLNARIAAKDSRLQRLRTTNASPTAVIEEFYLAALSRLPAEAELDHWNNQLAAADDTKTFLEDFVWAILSCHEFGIR